MKTIESLTTDEERAALVFRALGNPARMRIVLELAQRRACMTGTLASLLPLAPSTISGHLQVLKQAGLIRGDIEGPWNYCLEPDALRWVQDFCAQLESAARATSAQECC